MPAVRSAAAKVRKTLLQLAGDVFEISAGDLEIRDGGSARPTAPSTPT